MYNEFEEIFDKENKTFDKLSIQISLLGRNAGIRFSINEEPKLLPVEANHFSS